MSNSRHSRRKLQGKSGSSPTKSQRAAFKRQRAAWQFQMSMAKMTTQVTEAFSAGVFAPKTSEDEDEAQDSED